MTREIVLDTETTGLSPREGHRLVEIGCVELINHVPTGRTHHVYINPERDMPEEAFRVHGLSDDFLRDKALFKACAEDFLRFVEGGTLIIHNAPFDMAFLNAELEWAGHPVLANEVIDTVMLARKVHPGARVNLDALCRHYGIDNTRRTLHGALLDSEILAEVYLELIGGRQVALALGQQAQDLERAGAAQRPPARIRPEPLRPRLSHLEIAEHRRFVEELGAESLWASYPDLLAAEDEALADEGAPAPAAAPRYAAGGLS